MDDETAQELIPVRKAARATGISDRRLWTAIRNGDLAAYQIGGWKYVRMADLDAWIETKRYKPNDG